jgi:hypothetical protein
VWDKIVNSLDPALSAAQKLTALEVDPPVGTWNKIKITLDAELEAAIPERRRLSPLLKYAAAAAMLGFIAWAGISLINNKKTPDTVAKQNTPVLPENKLPVPPTPVTTEVPQKIDVTPEEIAATNIEEARNDAALEASKKTFAKLDVRTNSKIKEAANFYFATGTSRKIDIGTDNQDLIPTYTKDPDRYIVLMTPDGNIIRMSKKLSNMICCVSGEEEDKECKDQMKRWREKIACAPAGHSPGNFMDILGLLSSLQDDENF